MHGINLCCFVKFGPKTNQLQLSGYKKDICRIKLKNNMSTNLGTLNTHIRQRNHLGLSDITKKPIPAIQK